MFSAEGWSDFLASQVLKGLARNLAGVGGQSNLGANLHLQELQGSLASLEQNKAPGCNGLPIDFYISFWDLIGQDHLNVYREAI